MKKTFLFIALAFVGLTMSACGGGDSNTPADENANTVTSGTVESDASMDMGDVATSETDDDADFSSASNEWDEYLDEYEEYVDSYVKLYKKVMSGDMNAANEMAEITSSAQDLATKLGEGAATMTPQQIARFNEISQKMAKAL